MLLRSQKNKLGSLEERAIKLVRIILIAGLLLTYISPVSFALLRQDRDHVIADILEVNEAQHEIKVQIDGTEEVKSFTVEYVSGQVPLEKGQQVAISVEKGTSIAKYIRVIPRK